MCGVVGIFGRGKVNQALFDALNVYSIVAKMPQVWSPQLMVSFISEKIMAWCVMFLGCVTCNI